MGKSFAYTSLLILPYETDVVASKGRSVIFSNGQSVFHRLWTLLTSTSYQHREHNTYSAHCTSYNDSVTTSSTTIMAPTSFTPSTAPNYNAPAGTIATSLFRGADLSAYFAQFSVGTPPQKEWLLIDTGSPTISFFASQGTFCDESTKPCTYYGAFDNLTSS